MSYYTHVNFYELLEVDQRASAAEVHAAYRRQLDLVSGNSLATYGMFVGEDVIAIRTKLEEAFQVLSNPEKRRAYDLKTFQRSFVSPDARQPENGRDDPVDEAVERADAADIERLASESAAIVPPPAETIATQTTARNTDVVDHTSDRVIEKTPDPARAAEQPESPAAPLSEPGPDLPPVVLERVDGPSLQAAREDRGLTREAISAKTKIAEYYLQYIEEERFGSLPPGIYLRSYLKQYAEAIGADSEQVITGYLALCKAAENR